MKRVVRIGVALVLVGLLLPTAVAGIERVVGENKSVDSRESKTVENGGTALISYQGGNAFAEGGELSRLIAHQTR
jgi:hypothetical protein